MCPTRSLQPTPDGALSSAFAGHIIGPASVSRNVRQNTASALHKFQGRGVYVSDMKRTLIVMAVLTLMVVAGSAVYFASLSRHPGHVNAAKLLTAAKTYADGLKGQGLPVPTLVSMKELISRGLLTEGDVRGFAGMEVTVSLTADGSRPQEVLVRARLPDGNEIVALADGSVQQVRK